MLSQIALELKRPYHTADPEDVSSGIWTALNDICRFKLWICLKSHRFQSIIYMSEH